LPPSARTGAATSSRYPVGYIAGGGHDKRILFGALLELLLIIANIGTAVVIVPIVKDWTFLFGPGWFVGWGNGLILG
jgi:hypothetical protein